MSDLRIKCTKFDFGWGSARDPAGELTSLLQTPYLVRMGTAAPSSKTPPTLSALRTSILHPPAITISPGYRGARINTAPY